MKKIILLILIVVCFVFVCLIFSTIVVANVSDSPIKASKNIFSIPPSKSWTKIQETDGSNRWALVLIDVIPLTRIDFIAYVEGDNKKAYFIIRCKCSKSINQIETYRVEAGKVVGTGTNCAGKRAILIPDIHLGQIDQLPREAWELIP